MFSSFLVPTFIWHTAIFKLLATAELLLLLLQLPAEAAASAANDNDDDNDDDEEEEEEEEEEENDAMELSVFTLLESSLNLKSVENCLELLLLKVKDLSIVCDGSYKKWAIYYRIIVRS